MVHQHEPTLQPKPSAGYLTHSAAVGTILIILHCSIQHLLLSDQLEWIFPMCWSFAFKTQLFSNFLHTWIKVVCGLNYFNSQCLKHQQAAILKQLVGICVTSSVIHLFILINENKLLQITGLWVSTGWNISQCWWGDQQDQSWILFVFWVHLNPFLAHGQNTWTRVPRAHNAWGDYFLLMVFSRASKYWSCVGPPCLPLCIDDA